MFRTYCEPGPSTRAKPLPQVKEGKTSRSPNQGIFVADSEDSDQGDDAPATDPLATFYEQARVQKEDEVSDPHIRFWATPTSSPDRHE